MLGSSGIKLGEAGSRPPHQPGPHLLQKRGTGRRGRGSPPPGRARGARAGPGEPVGDAGRWPRSQAKMAVN